MLGQCFEMLKLNDWLKQNINCFKPRANLSLTWPRSWQDAHSVFKKVWWYSRALLHILAYFLLYANGTQPNCSYGLNRIVKKFFKANQIIGVVRNTFSKIKKTELKLKSCVNEKVIINIYTYILKDFNLH